MTHKLAYSDTGRGLAVVLVHGFANDRLLWDRQVNALQARYRLILPDLRGFGESGDADGRPISMDAYAGDIAALLDRLAVCRAVVGGISLGGYVALAFALRYPARTAGLVLANTRAIADSPEAAHQREQMAREIEARGAEAVVESYGDNPFRPDCPAVVKEAVRAMIRRQPVNGLVSGIRAMAVRPDRSGAIAALALPTLIVHGTEDRFIPVADAQAMHAAISGSRLVVLPGAGHLSCIDSPEPFNAALDAFFKAVAKGCADA